jgi:site-specific recombinase XerD
MRTSDLQRFADGWIIAGEIARHSERTSSSRRQICRCLFWFLRRQGFDTCGVTELRGFFVYLIRGHKDPGGRWGNPQLTKPVKDRTVKDYHTSLRTLFRWIIAEGALDSSPMERIPVPIDRPDTVQPFTEDQVLQLRAAAKNTRQGHRDEAIVAFLVDTGVRASELCGLRFCDFDISAKRATVEGKGGKTRPVYFGRITARALWQYLRADGRAPHEPLFQSERGEALTRSGLQQIIRRRGRGRGGAGRVVYRCGR